MLKKLIRYGISRLGLQYGSPTAPYPHTIYIVINSVCNLHCKTCDVGRKNKETQFYKNMMPGRDLDLTTLKKLVDEVKPFKPTIAITSTEPLLYKDLLEFSRYVKSAGLQLQITTNGYLLRDFAKDFVEIGVDSVWVSIDGPEPVHNTIRGNHNSYERAMNGIRQIDMEKSDVYGTPSRSKSPTINITYTISNHSYDHIVEFMLGIRPIHYMLTNISFSHLNFVTPIVAMAHNSMFGDTYPATVSCISDVIPTDINAGTLSEQISEARRMYSSITVSISPDISEEHIEMFYNHPEQFVPGYSRCKVPWMVSQIFSDGSVGVSTRCYNISFGNIHEQHFIDIWNGEKFKKFREDLHKNGGSFPACSRCCGIF